MSQMKECGLFSTGFTYTPKKMYDWAIEVTTIIKKEIEKKNVKNLKINVWPYKQNNIWVISVDIINVYSMDFFIGKEHDFDTVEPDCPNWGEALHMIGILTQMLNLEVVLGRTKNELNSYCTYPWLKNQTNAEMKLVLTHPKDIQNEKIRCN